MSKQKSLWRGVLAGIAGGLAALGATVLISSRFIGCSNTGPKGLRSLNLLKVTSRRFGVGTHASLMPCGKTS